MSDPNQPKYPDSNPYSPGGQPGYPAGGDPYQPGVAGYPVQGGYPGVQPGYPGSRSGHPGGPAGYPGQLQYPGEQGGYPSPPPYPAPGGYPGHSGAGYQSGPGLPPEPGRPSTITYAVWCWVAAVAFSMVGLVLILNSPIWDLALATARLSASEAIAAQTAVNLLKGFIVFLFVAVAAFFALFAYKMWAGRNWSRITITVLGVVCALLTALPTSREFTIAARNYETPQGQWPFYVAALLALAAIVLMFLGSSNRFFAASKTHQQAKAYQQIQR